MLPLNRDILLKIGGVFLVALFVQSNLWFSRYAFSDILLWSPGVAAIGSGSMLSLWGILPVHPGSTILFPGAIISLFHLSSDDSLKLLMTLYVSSLVTLISYLCLILRPHSLWWFLVATIFIPYKHMLDMTPTSVLTAFLAALYILLILYFREKNSSSNVLAVLGIVAGAMIATHIALGSVFLLVSLPYLWILAGRRSFITLLFASLYFAAFDPFLWVNPYEHISAMVFQAYVNHGEIMGFHYSYHSLVFPYAAGLLAFGYVYLQPKLSSLPYDFLVWLTAATCVICGALLFSLYHPVRYFFPLMIVAELFLPLFLLEAVAGARHVWKKFPVSGEYVIFLWLFFCQFPTTLYILIINLTHK